MKIYIVSLFIRMWSIFTGKNLGGYNYPFPFDRLKKMGFSNRELVHAYAVASSGKDMAPTQDELGCAEAVNNIVNRVLGQSVGGDVSTYRMYHELEKNNKKFERVEIWQALPGDIWISPSGYGDKKRVSNGHVGIVGKDRRIWSNNSSSTLWDKHWSWLAWFQYYHLKGRYPVYVYRILG